MKDRYFFPIALIVLIGMVYLAVRPGIGRLPSGCMAGNGQNYTTIKIQGSNLYRIQAGGDAVSEVRGGTDEGAELYIRSAAGMLSEAPEKGPHFCLAGDMEVQYSGQTVQITVRARPAEDRGAMQMKVNYSAGRAGESGWQVFDLKPGYQDYSFDYRVPVAEGEQGLDYLAVRPVVPEKARALYVESVTFSRLGRWNNEETAP